MEEIREKMVAAVKTAIRDAGKDYGPTATGDPISRKDWVLKHTTPAMAGSAGIGQAIAAQSQLLFTEDCESYIASMPDNPFSLQELAEMMSSTLKDYTQCIRGKLSSIQRKVLVALITTEVHGRDIIDGLAKAQVTNVQEFDWQKQLRYYISENDPERS